MAAAHILLLISAISLFSAESGAVSVDFLESTPGSYLQITPSNHIQDQTFIAADLSAAVSVLLGTAPSLISDESAHKMNGLLIPNPFHRPHAILFLTTVHNKSDGKSKLISAHHWELEPESLRVASVALSAYTTFLLLNGTVEEIFPVEIDVKLQELASFLGGTYVTEDGTLSLPLDDGTVTLNVLKSVNQVFIQKLLFLVEHVKNAAITLRNTPGGLIVGTLPVEELYQSSESSIDQEQASGLVLLIINKIFTYLDLAFNGGLVGVVVNGEEPILDFKFRRGLSRLQLLQTSDTLTAAVAEALTEKIIAYITGILVIVALIIGSCFLFKMPVTKDTLLYSGAKLD